MALTTIRPIPALSRAVTALLLCTTAAVAQNVRTVWMRSGHTAEITGITWTNDGAVVTSSLDRTVRAWEPGTGRLLWTAPIPGNGLTCVATTRGSDAVVAGDVDGVVHLAAGGARRSFPVSGFAIRAVRLTSDGGHVVAGTVDGIVALIRLDDGREVRRFVTTGASVTDLDVSSDDSLLIVTSADFAIRIWELHTGELVRTVQEVQSVPACVGFAPDRSTFATLGYDPLFADEGTHRGIVLFETATGRNLGPLGIGDAIDLDYSPDGRYLAVGASATGMRDLVDRARKSAGPIGRLAFSRDGSRLAFADGRTVGVRIVAPDTSEAILEPEVFTFTGHRSAVRAVSMSPDGGTVATASDDGFVLLWNAATGETLSRTNAHTMSIRSIRWSLDGRRIVTASHDGTVKLWDARMNLLHVYPLSASHPVTAAAMTPGGRLYASLGLFDGAVIALDTPSAKPVIRYADPGIGTHDIAVSGAAGLIASASEDGVVRVWRTAGGSPIARTPAGPQPIRAVSMSADGEIVFAGDAGGAIAMTEAGAASTLSERRAHAAAVSSLALSDDGHLLASASADSTVALWTIDAESFAPFAVCADYPSAYTSADVDLNGHRLVAATTDGTVIMRSFDDPSAAPAVADRQAASISVAPSPATSVSTVTIRADRAGPALITVVDATGRLVGTVIDDHLQAGEHRIAIDVRSLESGLYVVRAHIAGATFVARLIVVQ